MFFVPKYSTVFFFSFSFFFRSSYIWARSGSSSSSSARYWLQLGSPLTVGADGIGRPVWGLTHQHSPLWPWRDILHWNRERVQIIVEMPWVWSKIWCNTFKMLKINKSRFIRRPPVWGYTAPFCHSWGYAVHTDLPEDLGYLWRASWISSPGSGQAPADTGSWRRTRTAVKYVDSSGNT